MNIRVLLAFAAIVAVVALSAAPASATGIALINPLMEDPNAVGPLSAAHPGQYPYPTWQGAGVDPTWDSVPQGSSTSGASGWQAAYGGDPFDNIVEVNPTADQFAGANGVSPLASPAGIASEHITGGEAVTNFTNTLYGGALKAPTLGSQALYNITGASNDVAVLSDNAGKNGVAQTNITLQANMTYTLTVAVGKDLTGPYEGFSLEVADTTLGGNLVNAEFHGTGPASNPSATTGSDPDPGTFYDYSINFNSSDFIYTGNTKHHSGTVGVAVGDVLRIGFVQCNGTYITDVRLDVSPTVPEPSTLVLLASGLIGLLAYAWRKRK
jgi:hypothetical protein